MVVIWGNPSQATPSDLADLGAKKNPVIHHRNPHHLIKSITKSFLPWTGVVLVGWPDSSVGGSFFFLLVLIR